MNEASSDNSKALVPIPPGVHIRSGLSEVLDDIEQRYEDRTFTGGVASGFVDLDSTLDGLQPGCLYLLAGRPGSGKSSLARNIAVQSMMISGGSSLLVSTETSARETYRKILSAEALVDTQRMTLASLSEEEWQRIAHATAMLSKHDLAVVESAWSVQAVQDSVRKASRLADRQLLVVIDCVNTLGSDAAKQWDSRHSELSDIAHHLKRLAVELQVPVIATAQVNRNLEARTDKRPLLVDLHGSSSLESVADVVIFLYRDELYDDQSPDRGLMELLIAKNRLGPTRRVRLAFRAQFCRSDNLARPRNMAEATEEASTPETVSDLDEASPSARTGQHMRPDAGPR